MLEKERKDFDAGFLNQFSIIWKGVTISYL